MDVPTLTSKAANQVLILLPTILLGAVVYLAQRFTTPVSPTIPYVGGNSLPKRLKALEEYGKDPVEFLRKTRKELGDVFCMDMLMFKMVFLLGAEHNREVFRAPEEQLSFWESIRWAMGPRISEMIDYPGWIVESMKPARNALLGQDRLADYYEWAHSIVEENFENWTKEPSVPLFKSFSYTVIQIMIIILMGEEFLKKHQDELVPMMAQFERDLQHPILRALPWSLWRFSTPGAALRRADKRFCELVTQEMHYLLKNPKIRRSRRDYFATLVENFGDKYQYVYGTHIMTVVFGGHANMAMTIPWLYLHARRTPGALERIAEEAALPSDARKPFLEACLRETGRLYTNTTVMRVAKKRTKVGAHTIPAGTLVVLSPAATQRSEDWQPDAGHWKPQRFLKKNAYANWFQKGEFVQFGMGQHACPGEKLARMVIFDVVLKVWMEKYVVDVASGLQDGEKGVDGVGAEPAWTEENFGTPSIRGEDVQIRVRKRVS